MQNFAATARKHMIAVVTFFTDKSLTPEQRKPRMIFGVVATVIIVSIFNMIIGGITSLFDGGNAESDSSSSQPAEQESLEASPVDSAAYAATINEAALEELGISQWTEACLRENNVHWPCLVMDMESDSSSDITVMLMMNGDDADAERLAEDAAYGIFELVGKEHGLKMIQVVDSGFNNVTIEYYNEAPHG